MSFDWFASNHDKRPEQICELDIQSYAKVKLLKVCNDDKKAKEMHNLLVYGKQTGNEKKKFESEYCVNFLPEEIKILSLLNLMNPTVDINKLPFYSFFLQFTFTLATPYLSKDDEEFYICENPIKKDKVFKVPMVSGSTWKGNMRWTARQIINNDAVIERLFGNEKGEENMEKFRRGRLNFYPTFFNQIGLEVINPHDRKTKAGTQPIYIESVPEGASGKFSLLYVPFDLMGRPDSKKVKEEVAGDLMLVYDAVRHMMLTYGFSAKKSSGFGIVKNELSEISCLMKEKGVKKTDKVIPAKSKKMKSMSLDDFKKTGSEKKETFDDLGMRVNAIKSKLISGGNNG